MFLLIPVDEKDFEDAKIVSFEKRVAWLLVEMEQGFVKKHNFYEDKEEIEEFIDYVVIKDVKEGVQEFLDEGIDVLVAPLQVYAEDVIEAYKFRELHEL